MICTAPGQAPGFTLSIQSQLVVEAVTVKDKQGNFVEGLTAKDFVVTEDGAPQTIRYCEEESLAQNVKPLPEEPPRDESITIYNRLARKQIQPEPMEKDRYKDQYAKPLGTMPLNFDLGVSALSPGKYDRQVAIRNPTAHKANFWRAPIELAP